MLVICNKFNEQSQNKWTKKCTCGEDLKIGTNSNLITMLSEQKHDKSTIFSVHLKEYAKKIKNKIKNVFIYS